MTTPIEVLRALRDKDSTRPRLTWYAAAPGERIELSGKVLDNWVAKAGNLLQEEYDAGPGRTVAVDLPAGHWRSFYWACATWTIGATLAVGSSTRNVSSVTDPDVLVCTQPPPDGEAVIVTLAALARSHPEPLRGGLLDEAAALATYDDVLEPWADAEPDDPALIGPATSWSYADVAPSVSPDSRAGARVFIDPGTGIAPTLRAALGVWAADGAVVIVPDRPDRERILQSEGVTARA